LNQGGSTVIERKGAERTDLAGYAGLRARIVERYPGLSHQQQAIATFALAHPETMAMETAEQLARRLDVQPSALVRFAHALGYQGFRELKQLYKAQLIFDGARARNGGTPAHDIKADPLADALARGKDDLDRLERAFDRQAFAAAVATLRAAPAIYVTAQHLAYPFAALLAWTLIGAGRQCNFLDNTGGFALPQSRLARPDEVLLAISVAPYQPSVVQAANAHAERGGKVVAITDAALSPLAASATVLLELPGDEQPGSPSLAGLTCIVQALALALTEA
jgi:DNA-binding MurR/RpiR family transcriptional regulator